jgi:hypothetical protein
VTRALFKTFASLAFQKLNELASIRIHSHEINREEGQLGDPGKTEWSDRKKSTLVFMLCLVAHRIPSTDMR